MFDVRSIGNGTLTNEPLFKNTRSESSELTCRGNRRTSKERANLDRRQALLNSEKAKLRQQKARLASGSAETSITCDAARAVLADYGFETVKSEQCTGKMFKFGATRDGTVFSIDISLNGELAKVRRLPPDQ